MKILIISYYAFPLNAVASYRIASFCEGFSKEGADVTLLTRHWDTTFKSWEDVLSSNESIPKVIKENGYRQIFLPFKAKPIDNKFRLISTLNTFKDYLIGNLQSETNAFKNFKDYALALLQKEKDFDLILVSAQPLNLIKLGSVLSEKSKVPYVADMRDYLNNKYLSSNHTLTNREKLLNALTSFHVKKWMKNTSLVSTVSPILGDVFKRDYCKNTILALNGYEQKYFQNENLISHPNESFTIRHLGTAHPGLNFDIIISGIMKFKNLYPKNKFTIELIGTHNDDVENKFVKTFDSEYLHLIKTRIPKDKVVNKTTNSDVLLLASNMHKGTYGTKLFDYLASGSHILLCPPDNSVVENLIKNHENGSVANTEDEVCKILEEQYKLWEKGENKSKINNYPQFARENIAKELYNTLKVLVDEK